MRSLLRAGRMAVLVCAILPVTETLKAHPHAWIDVDIQLIWNRQGHISGFRQQWLFDSAVSAYFLGEDSVDAQTMAKPEVQPRPLEEELRANAAIKPVVERLGPFNFFTGIRLDGKAYPLDGVDDMHGFIHQDGRLGMRFVVPFAEPIDPATQVIRFAVFDPTYFTAMLYRQENISQARPIMPINNHCATSLEIPQPDPEYVAYVAALPPTASNDDTIGDAFAVWVQINCETP